jgi:transposase
VARENPRIDALQGELARLEVQRAGLTQEYQESSPRVAILDAQIDRLRRQLTREPQERRLLIHVLNPVREEMGKRLKELETEVEGLRAAHAQLESEMQSRRQRMNQLGSWEIQLNQMTRARDTAEKQYLMLAGKLQDLQIRENARRSTARIIERATAPISPVRPRKMVNLALSLILVHRGGSLPPEAGWDILGLGEPDPPATGGQRMPSPRPLLIQLTKRQRALFDHLVRREHSSQQLLRRLNIVRLAADGFTNEAITHQLHLHRETARTWRKRWADAADCLQAAEAEGATDTQLLRLIEAILADEPRPGAPATFSPEALAQLLALACEEPQTSSLPISHWTPTELAKEAIRRGIVSSISPRSVGRFLKGGRSQAPSQPLLAQRSPRGQGDVRGASRPGL